MKNRKHHHHPPTDGGGAPAVEAETANPAAPPATPGETAPDASAVQDPVPTQPSAEPEKTAAEDRYLRLMADFDNFRKRTLREKNDLYRMANEELLQDLLPILDHMDLALDAAQAVQTDAAISSGFKIVGEQLAATVKKFGAVPIEADGQAFDPDRHEALAHLASDTVPENTVIKQVRRGYLLGGKLLRPAQVVVSRGPAEPKEAPASGGELTQEEEGD